VSDRSRKGLPLRRTASANKPYPFHRASCLDGAAGGKAITTNNAHNSARINQHRGVRFRHNILSPGNAAIAGNGNAERIPVSTNQPEVFRG